MIIEINNLQNTLETLENLDNETATRVIPEISEKLYRNIQLYARPHTDTGNMFRNIVQKVAPNRLSARVGIEDRNMLVNWNGRRVNYAEFVIYGTRPHTIQPRNRIVLRFFHSVGDFIFARVVHHPGYRGDNFMNKAINKTMEDLNEFR